MYLILHLYIRTRLGNMVLRNFLLRSRFLKEQFVIARCFSLPSHLIETAEFAVSCGAKEATTSISAGLLEWQCSCTSLHSQFVALVALSLHSVMESSSDDVQPTVETPVGIDIPSH